MNRVLITTLSILSVAGLTVVACDQQPDAPRQRVATSRPHVNPGTPVTPVDPSTGPIITPDNPDNPDNPNKPDQPTASIFDRFCQTSARLDVTRLFFGGDWSLLCDESGRARPFLYETLRAAAYNGTGSVVLQSLPTVEAEDSITIGRYAGATALIGTAKSLFEGLLPLQTDWQKMKSLGVSLIDSQVDERLLDSLPLVGAAARGSWSKWAKVRKQVGILSAEGIFEFRSDFFELIPGEAYLATLMLTKSIKTIQNARYFTVLLQDGSVAWAFSVTLLAMDNFGIGGETFPRLVRETVANTFINVRRSSSVLWPTATTP